MSCLTNYTIKAIVLFILTFGTAGLLAGCSEEITRLELAKIPAPEGGVIPAIAVVSQGEHATIVAPSKNTFYTRQTDDSAWSTTATTLPDTLNQEGYNLFDSLCGRRTAKDFPTNQLFTARKDELWMVAAPSYQSPPRLLVSLNAAKTWTKIPLPASLAFAPSSNNNQPTNKRDDNNFSSPSRIRTNGTSTQLRLLKTADNSLFLTDSSQIWQFLPSSADIHQFSAEPENAKKDAATVNAKSWKRVPMEGIDFTLPSLTTGLPPVIRSYLPATPDRPYETLTVLHEQLLLYHRPQGTEQWLLTSTLPTVDRHLLDVPGQKNVYLLTSDAIYTAHDDGQHWERVHFNGRGPQSSSNSRLFALPGQKKSDAHILLLGANDGSIRRSIDAGQTWQDAQPRDLDQRAITGFAYDPTNQKLWASTAGNGVLSSTDHGLSWTSNNHNLRATNALTIANGPDDKLLLGTDAGLFRLIGPPSLGNWTPLHQRATSAIYVNPENQRIFSGTLGGSIVVLHADNQAHTSEAAPLGEHNSVLFQPPGLESTNLPPTAIVDIRPRPKSQEMFAWSYQQGPLNSNDAGASWRRMRLSDALTTALRGQIISDFATEQQQRLFVVSRSIDLANPSQLWRSQNNGDSWHAIYFHLQNATESPLRIERDLQATPERLFLIHSNHIAYSIDQGSTWTTVNGPWQKGNVATFSINDQHAVIISNMPHASDIFIIKLSELATLRSTSDITRYSLIWPLNQQPSSETTLSTVTNNQHLFINNADTLYAGTLPRQRTRLPEGVAVILTAIGLLILTAASFAFLRQR